MAVSSVLLLSDVNLSMHIKVSIFLIIVATTHAKPLVAKYLPPLADVANNEQHSSYLAPFSALKFSTAPNVADNINYLEPYSSSNSNSARFSISQQYEKPSFEQDSSYRVSSEAEKSNSAPFSTLQHYEKPNFQQDSSLRTSSELVKSNSAPFSSLKRYGKPNFEQESSLRASSDVLKSHSVPFSTSKFSAVANVADNINYLAPLSSSNSYSAQLSALKLNEKPNFEHVNSLITSSNALKSNSAQLNKLKFTTAPNIADNNKPLKPLSSLSHNSASLSLPQLNKAAFDEHDSNNAAFSNAVKNNSALFSTLEYSSTPNIVLNKISSASHRGKDPFSSTKLETSLKNSANKYAPDPDSTRDSSALNSYSATVAKEIPAPSYSAPAKSGVTSMRHTSIVIPADSANTSLKPNNTQLPLVQHAAAFAAFDSYSAPFSGLQHEKASGNEFHGISSAPLSVSKINSAQYLSLTQHPASNSVSLEDHSATLADSQHSYSAPTLSHLATTSSQDSTNKTPQTAYLNSAAYLARSAAAVSAHKFYSDLETGSNSKRFNSPETGTRYAQNGGYLYR